MGLMSCIIVIVIVILKTRKGCSLNVIALSTIIGPLKWEVICWSWLQMYWPDHAVASAQDFNDLPQRFSHKASSNFFSQQLTQHFYSQGLTLAESRRSQNPGIFKIALTPSHPPILSLCRIWRIKRINTACNNQQRPEMNQFEGKENPFLEKVGMMIWSAPGRVTKAGSW